MLATFAIFLREGIEASMIVAILLAYLAKLGLRRHFRDVYVGVGAAMVLVAGGGTAAYLCLTSYAGSRTQAIFETVTYALAAVLLTCMTFWMQRHAATMSSELRQRADAALEGRARWGLGLLAFQAVGREGVESMVFTLAIVFATGTHGALVGGAAGLAVSLVVAGGIYKLGARLDVRRFFRVVGALLLVFAAGLLADTVENVQQLGWVHTLDHPLWDSTGLLAEGSTLGDVVHSFVGYADHPTGLQVLVWGAFVVLAAGAWVRTTRRPARRAAATGAPAGA